jgi:hypothetical protein
VGLGDVAESLHRMTGVAAAPVIVDAAARRRPTTTTDGRVGIRR